MNVLLCHLAGAHGLAGHYQSSAIPTLELILICIQQWVTPIGLSFVFSTSTSPSALEDNPNCNKTDETFVSLSKVSKILDTDSVLLGFVSFCSSRSQAWLPIHPSMWNSRYFIYFHYFQATWHIFNLGAQHFNSAEKCIQKMPTVDFNSTMIQEVLGYLRKLLRYDMKHMSAGSGETSSGPGLLLEVRQLEQNTTLPALSLLPWAAPFHGIGNMVLHWEYSVSYNMNLRIPVHLIHNLTTVIYSVAQTKKNNPELGFNPVSIYSCRTNQHSLEPNTTCSS